MVIRYQLFVIQAAIYVQPLVEIFMCLVEKVVQESGRGFYFVSINNNRFFN
jgi:hypothetical protein